MKCGLNKNEKINKNRINKMIKYSFIIPVKEINNYIREAIPNILKIDRDDYEIIIYPDEIDNNFFAEKTKQIATGKCGPAEKRSLAMKDANGEILIFIDDDAYPDTKCNFLDILDKDFQDEKIVAVGGPAVTPSSDNELQKISGTVFLSSLSGGNPERYVPVGEKKFVDDWPSVNLAVRKEAFILVNGFNSKYWPGEDTLFCLDLIKKTGKKILYDPNLIVFHHRRAGLLRHLKQIQQYGLHRGFFAKKYPETSFKIKYFIPSIFLVFVITSIISALFGGIFVSLYVFGYLLYLIALVKAFFDIYKYEKNRIICLRAMYYIFFTHIFYGYSFIKGFMFTDELNSQLRNEKLKN